MALSNYLAVCQDYDFVNRVKALTAKTAVNVGNEGAEEPNHTARANFASYALKNDVSFQMSLALIMSNPTIQSTIDSNFGSGATAAGAAVPDGDIEFAIASVWNPFAGV